MFYFQKFVFGEYKEKIIFFNKKYVCKVKIKKIKIEDIKIGCN